MNFASLIQWFKKAAETKSKNAELISFLTLRRAIGWLGMLLPVVLVIGSMLVGKCNVVQPSISHYYYTNMREVFVGVLSAVSLFLFSYKGHSNLDSWASNVAGFFCLCVAIFPTDIESYPCQNKLDSFISWSHQEYIHLTCASLFFIVLALMSIFLFTKSEEILRRQRV